MSAHLMRPVRHRLLGMIYLLRRWSRVLEGKGYAVEQDMR